MIFVFFIFGVIVGLVGAWACASSDYYNLLDEFLETKKMLATNQLLLSDLESRALKYARESEVNNTDAQRYRRIRYYLENDNGELTIEAYYGPHVISTAQELDNMIDEDLDKEFVDSLYDTFGFKRSQ